VPAARFWGGLPPGRFLAASLPPATIAFSTTSSIASLPALFEAAEGTLHLPRPITGFVLPLAATLNRAGSSLFQGAAVVFLAHLYGGAIPPAALAGAVLALFFTAFTIAAVPSASIMTLPPALAAMGVPLDGMGILLGIDRIPDMFRTAVSVTGDVALCAAMRGGAERHPPE
jgi:Na+/H+-dicarboxylate symporter